MAAGDDDRTSYFAAAGGPTGLTAGIAELEDLRKNLLSGGPSRGPLINQPQNNVIIPTMGAGKYWYVDPRASGVPGPPQSAQEALAQSNTQMPQGPELQSPMLARASSGLPSGDPYLDLLNGVAYNTPPPASNRMAQRAYAASGLPSGNPMYDAWNAIPPTAQPPPKPMPQGRTYFAF